MKLDEIAKVVRSKNAGPLHLTFDLMFANEGDYNRVLQSPMLTPARIAEVYDVPVDSVQIIPYAPALAIKIAMDRKVVAGDPGDRDVYGAQQHAPLLELEL
jgi:hypothetical protein